MSVKKAQTMAQRAEQVVVNESGVVLQKRAYSKPQLEELGDLVGATLAPSPGQFESGRGTGFRSN